MPEFLEDPRFREDTCHHQGETFEGPIKVIRTPWLRRGDDGPRDLTLNTLPEHIAIARDETNGIVRFAYGDGPVDALMKINHQTVEMTGQVLGLTPERALALASEIIRAALDVREFKENA